jgi:hypothetical protein
VKSVAGARRQTVDGLLADCAHGHTPLHGLTLQRTERVGLAETLMLLKESLRALDEFAGSELALQIVDGSLEP